MDKINDLPGFLENEKIIFGSDLDHRRANHTLPGWGADGKQSA
jgi:hypothetical protein